MNKTLRHLQLRSVAQRQDSLRRQRRLMVIRNKELNAIENLSKGDIDYYDDDIGTKTTTR